VGAGATSLLDQAKEGKMRRVVLMLAAMGLMVSLCAAAAYAANIEGTSAGEILLESDLNDTIKGRGGGDIIDAQIFSRDRDVVYGNPGDDEIGVEDGDNRDTVYGGQGDDVCFGDPGDELHCEDTPGVLASPVP
jgi:RTX calcium-binding nonapeptide repeat (4 copies)